jgi:hypothetical protein
LLSINILSLAIILVISGDAFSDVWPGEIPPSWELEWVEDDERRHHGWPLVMLVARLANFRWFRTLNLFYHVKYHDL